MLLTIGMMVKNEEKHLEECLKALNPIRKKVNTELIIIDTGSDDNTVNIANEFTDKVYFHPWNDNFSEMRNKVISYSKGDWYFSLDGDEVVNNSETIINFFNSGEYRKYNTALVTQKNYTNLKENRFSKILVPRLFKNDDEFHFEGAIHNQPQYKKPIIALETILDHYGYVTSDAELIERKFQRTSNILKDELEKDPNNIYYWFQLSKSYNMHKDQEDALDSIEKAYELAKKNNIDLRKRMYIYVQLSKMYLVNNRYKMSEKIAEEALKLKDGYVDLYYYLARAQLMQNKKEEAFDNLKKYIKLINNYEQSNSKIDTSVDDETMGNYNIAYRFIVNLAADLEIETDYAISSAFKIDIESQLQHAIHPFISICLNNNKYGELKRFYNEKLKKNNLENNFITKLEKIILNLNDIAKYNIAKIFSDKDIKNDYYLLNQVRKSIFDDDLIVDIKDLSKIYYVKKNNFYGDIIYYLLKYWDKEAYQILSIIKEKDLNRFISYLNNKYDDINELIINFIDYSVNGISNLRVNKSLGRYLLALDNENREYDSDVIYNYLDSGIKYINKLYSREIIKNELTKELKNEEEEFLLYMKKGLEVKETDTKKYVNYLRKALNSYPAMKKVVEYLISEVKKKQDKVTEKLEKEKKKFKTNIEILINNGQLKEAEKLIEEYKNNFKIDTDIYSMLGVIEIIKENFERAKSILDKGARKVGNDFDLLFNLGYSYEQLKEYEKAKETYFKAKKIAKLKDQKIEVKESLARLKDYDKKVKDKSNEINRFIYNNKLRKPKIFKEIENGNITENDIIKNWDEDSPLVSINCITYNHENYIKDALNSFLMQKTSFPFEIIVHDDASTDNTAEVIKKYEERFPNIIKGIYQEENIYSKNKRIFKVTNSMSNGEYIAICEGDDFWLDKNKLQKQIYFLENNKGYVLSSFDAAIIDNEYNILEKSKLANKFKRNYSKEEMKINKGYSLTLNMVFRNVLNDLPPEYNMVGNGDRFLFSLLGNYGKYKFQKNIIPSVYRIHNKSVWSSKNIEERSISEMNTWFLLYKYYRRKNDLKISETYWKVFMNAALKINKKFHQN